MAETKVPHQATSRGLVWRSLGMLRAVRGLIVVLLLLGLIASALPYISAAAFGPMMQVVADAGASGNLSGVWDLQGPLLASEDDLLGSLAGPVVPFAVLLTAWAVSLLLAQLMYFSTPGSARRSNRCWSRTSANGCTTTSKRCRSTSSPGRAVVH